MHIAPGKIIPLLLTDGNDHDRIRIARFTVPMCSLARIEEPQWLAPGSHEPAAAVAVVGSLRLLIPLAGLIDVGAEQARLKRDVARVEGEIKKCQAKLGNTNFLAHAPAAVVDQERQRLNAWEIQLGALREQLDKLTT